MTMPHHDSQMSALRAFRKATDGLSEHSAGGQVVALRYELFQALRRAVEGETRSQTLARQLDEARSDAEARAQEQQAMAAYAARELGEVRTHYEQRLRVLHGVQAALRRRCATLEEVCRSLLLTLEQAACAQHDDDAALERVGGGG
jgi:hypothetical protein